MKTLEEILTNLESSGFDIKGILTSDIGLEAPVRSRKAVTNPLLVPSLLVDAKLSPETFQMEVERLDKLARKRQSLRNRKKYTRKRGTVHPKKKEATRRRRRATEWSRNPLGTILWGYGSKDIDKSLWEKHIAPLWDRYDPKDLSIKKYRGYGTREKPYTIYSLDVVHKTEGIVYSGENQQIYDLSGGSKATA